MLEDAATGAAEELHPAGVFVFIGLDPNTEFVQGAVDLDDARARHRRTWGQTSMRGRVRGRRRALGSTKQLACAVGEGAAAAIGIRQYLEALDARPMHMM